METRLEDFTAGREKDAQTAQDMEALLDRIFDLPERDWSQYSPLPLAYLGDAVYDLAVRTILVKRANMQTLKLHRAASEKVSARAQAKSAKRILPLLDQEELAVFRRGHNAKPATMAKNASREEYLTATGLETLIGYLYLERRYARMLELIFAGLEETGAAGQSLPDR